MLPRELQCLVYAYADNHRQHFGDACKTRNLHDLKMMTYLRSYVWQLKQLLILKLLSSCRRDQHNVVQRMCVWSFTSGSISYHENDC